MATQAMDPRRLRLLQQRLFAFDMPGGIPSVPYHLRENCAGAWLYGQALDPEGLYAIDDLHQGTPRPVQPGRCANFDGVDDYIDLSAVTGVGRASPYTFCAWVKPNAISAVAKPVWMHANSASDRNGVSIENSSIYCGSYNGSAYDGKVASGITTSWQHIAYVRVDGGAGDKIYINGVEATYAGGTAYNLSGTEKVLGKTANGSTFFPGKMFDARIYNRALTDSEISQIYNTSKPGGRPGIALYPSSLVGHWKLDDGARRYYHATVAYDSSGNGYHGAVANSSASFHYEGADVPFSWQNEVGYTPESQAAYALKTDLWTPKFDEWTAAGTDAKAVALTAQSWAGRTGLYAVKFLSGALAGYSANRVHTGTDDFTAAGSKLYVVAADIALSRPLVGSESVRLYFTGGEAGPYVDLSAGYNATLGDVTKFQTFTGPTTVFAAGRTQSFVIYPPDAVTGGDLTVYVDNVKYLDMGAGTDAGAMEGRYYGERIPQKSSVPSTDVLGNTLTYTGEAPRNAKLIDSFCGTFDGVDDQAAAAAAVSSGGESAFTAAAWIYRIGGSAYQGIFGDWGNDGAKRWQLYISNNDELRANVSSGGTTNRNRNSVAKIPANTWTHVAATFAAGEIKLFIDGVEAATTLTDATVVTTLANVATVLRIGTSSAERFSGRAADLRWYNSALSAGDVLLLYQGKEPATSPVGHWPLAEGNGAILYDVSGNGLHATLTGATLATFWGTRQNQIHRNIRRGFRDADNLLSYSQDLSNAIWIKNGTVVVAADTITDPQGNATADKVTFTGAIAYLTQQVAFTNGQQYTLSFWGKCASGTQNANMGTTTNVDTGVAIQGVVLTTEWQRFSYTFTAGATDYRAFIARTVSSGTDELHIWGVQLVKGAAARNYTPTTGTTFDRVRIPTKNDGIGAADGNTLTNPAGQWHNQAETELNFAPVAAPWTEGLSAPTSYAYGDTLPANGFKEVVTVGDVPREQGFYITKV